MGVISYFLDLLFYGFEDDREKRYRKKIQEDVRKMSENDKRDGITSRRVGRRGSFFVDSEDVVRSGKFQNYLRILKKKTKKDK